MKNKLLCILIVCLLLAVQFAEARDKGTVKIVKLFSEALAGNAVQENPEREVSVYLPPGYFKSEKRYPILYLLHGMGDNHLNFIDDADKFATIQGLMDEGIAKNRFSEMIIVTPNASTKWGGSFYVNSKATGNWEDFTTKELVNYIDANYRTIAESESRAIAGHSMGGFGAIFLAMKHPEIFSIVYSLNGGFISFTGEINAKNPEIKKFIAAKNTEELIASNSKQAIGMLAVAQAFSPNPSTPSFLADKPFKLQGNKLVPNQTAYQKWIGFDVRKMAVKYKENLRKLKAVKFDAAFDEEFKFININNHSLSKKLAELEIPHVFEEYNGDHRNKLWGLKGRISNELLPFIFANIKTQ